MMTLETHDEQTTWREQATEATLAASGLPEPVQRRLAAARYETPEALRAAIEGARDEVAQLAAAQVIQIGSVPPRGRIGGMTTGLDHMARAMDWLFGVRDTPAPEPALRSVRALYQTLTGDYDFYERHLKALGYKIRVQILNYSDGMPGDVGFFLRW